MFGQRDWQNGGHFEFLANVNASNDVEYEKHAR